MKKLIALLMAMMMLLSCCFAEDEEEVQTVVEVLYVEASGEQVKLGYTADTEILDVDGLKFKDLNKNGALDVYEDWRKPAEERVNDLLSQMSATDKAAQMLHMTLVTLKESWFTDLGVGFVPAYTYLSAGAEDPQLPVDVRNGGGIPAFHPVAVEALLNDSVGHPGKGGRPHPDHGNAVLLILVLIGIGIGNDNQLHKLQRVFFGHSSSFARSRNVFFCWVFRRVLLYSRS